MDSKKTEPAAREEVAHDALVSALKKFANLDKSVNSGLWEIKPEYCEQARAALALAGVAPHG